MTTNILQVIESNGDLVIDSRLIADTLGIEHRAFMQTMKRYQDRIESRFGVITFEMSKPIEGSLGGRPEKFALLTESQATALMTFSKNTDQVIDCKLNLVAAFEKAKAVIREVIPAQNDRIRELELMLALATAEKESAIAQKVLLDTRKAITELTNPTVSALILGATIVMDRTPVERVIDSHSGRVYEGIGITAIATKLGFKTTKACWLWLDSIGFGKTSDAWELQLSAVEHHKLKPEAFERIFSMWDNGDRQRFIGE
jgi:phage regulator Rha-like protein